MTADDDSACTTESDLAASDGEVATVRGTYTQIDMSQHPRKGPVYRGHVGIELADETVVHLGPTWSSDAERDDEEIERLAGEQVRATGEVHRKMPSPPDEIAYIMGPCLDPVEDVVAEK